RRARPTICARAHHGAKNLTDFGRDSRTLLVTGLQARRERSPMIAPSSRRSLAWLAPAALFALTSSGGCWSRNLPTVYLDGGSSNGSGGSFDGGVPVASGGTSGSG